MSRSRRAGTAAVIGAVLLALVPTTVVAHAIGGEVYTLPIPLWLYLAGAAVAVGASFVVTVALSRRVGPASHRLRDISPTLAATTRAILRNLGIAWWYGAIGVGFVIGDISALPAVLFWIGIWVGLPIVAVLIGNPWPSLSPFRTTFAALEWLVRRIGLERLDLGLRYPRWLARWPAVVLLAIGTWIELILPGSAAAPTVAALLTGYTIVTLLGMLAFGQVAWLRNAELFEVVLGWLGRIGAIGRRAVSPTLCDGCGEACRIERCVDCPECAVAADDAERVPAWRPWLAGLTEVTRAGWSDAAFIVLLLAGVTFDGLQETRFAAIVLEAVMPPLTDAFGVTLLAFLLADTLTMAIVVVGFWLAFGVMIAVTRALGPAGRLEPGAYAATLLPIAAGYLIAHDLTYVIQGAAWLPTLILDPLNTLAPDLSGIPVAGLWYLSVIAIVGGHIAGIVLAHRVALRSVVGRATVAGLPMVALMIGYTILSLWIIAQPIVVEPGTVPSALR
jgi:hypothetical protein